MAYPVCEMLNWFFFTLLYLKKIMENASMVKSVNFFFFFLSMANSVGLARTMGKRSEELTNLHLFDTYNAWMQ